MGHPDDDPMNPCHHPMTPLDSGHYSADPCHHPADTGHHPVDTGPRELGASHPNSPGASARDSYRESYEAKC